MFIINLFVSSSSYLKKLINLLSNCLHDSYYIQLLSIKVELVKGGTHKYSSKSESNGITFIKKTF